MFRNKIGKPSQTFSRDSLAYQRDSALSLLPLVSRIKISMKNLNTAKVGTSVELFQHQYRRNLLGALRIGAVPYRSSEQRTVLNFSLLSHKAQYSGSIINLNSAQCPRQSVNPIMNFVHSCHAEVIAELFFHHTIKKLLHPLLSHWYILLLPLQQKKHLSITLKIPILH